MLHPVILAGGSGTRLWPLSLPERPKQYLSLLGGETMLENTLVRLQGMPTSPPLVVCNESHGLLAIAQLADTGHPPLSAILEPEGRNTAPALTLAALHLRKSSDRGGDAMMLAMPADNVVRSPKEFQRSLRAALPLANDGYMVTFGIFPLEPHTGYGYIRRERFLQQEPDLPAAMKVAAFVEKPSMAMAQEYLRDGRYLWNSGIFLMTASVWLEALNRSRPDIAQACQDSYDKAKRDGLFLRPDREGFLACPAESIDYAVMERTKEDPEIRVAVVPLAGGWSDLGSWAQVWEERDGDEGGNVVEGSVYLESVQDSLLLAGDRTIAAVGLNDAVVVETPDAVLVASRDKVQEVRNIAEKLRSDKNEHPWGRRRIVDRGPGFTVHSITIEPGNSYVHNPSANGETWTQASGRLTLSSDSDKIDLVAGQTTRLSADKTYRIDNFGSTPARSLLLVISETEFAT